MGTRKDLRERFRVRMGFPEDTATGNSRFDASLNSALRHLWSDLPDVLLSEEIRFRTEPPIDIGTVRMFSNAAGIIDNLTVVMNSTETDLPNEPVLRGRWIEFYDETSTPSQYHIRRIHSVFKQNYEHSTGTITEAVHIVLDKPYVPYQSSPAVPANKAIKSRIYTLDYPYPADVQKVTHLIYNPDDNSSEVLPMLRGDHDRWRRSVGWRATGKPEAWCRGDFFQLKAPRYTPEVQVNTVPEGPEQLESRWGFDASGKEHGDGPFLGTDYQPKYGPAGTFSYRVVHVWGRRKESGAFTFNDGDRGPWYISAPSAPSEQISTKWGEGYIQIKTPNIDMAHGYNPNTNYPSYHKYGLEKWIFRARHETEEFPKSASINFSGPVEDEIPADGVYYLWAIESGHSTHSVDRGQADPPEREFPLEQWHGHQSIRFDRLPDNSVPILMHVVMRPPQLHHDHDSPRVPEECVDALFALCASYLSGDRDGNMERKQFYLSEYFEHRKRLIRLVGIEDATMPSFGDGLGLSTSENWVSFGQTVKEG